MPQQGDRHSAQQRLLDNPPREFYRCAGIEGLVHLNHRHVSERDASATLGRLLGRGTRHGWLISLLSSDSKVRSAIRYAEQLQRLDPPL